MCAIQYNILVINTTYKQVEFKPLNFAEVYFVNMHVISNNMHLICTFARSSCLTLRLTFSARLQVNVIMPDS